MNQSYFSERLDALEDQNKSLYLILPEIMIQGLWAQEESGLLELEQIAEQLNIAHSYRLIEFFAAIYQSLENPLLFQLIADCFTFSQFSNVWLLRKEIFSNPESIADIRNALKQIIIARRQNDPQNVIKILYKLYWLSPPWSSLVDPSVSKEHQTSFQWNPYKGRIQYCAISLKKCNLVSIRLIILCLAYRNWLLNNYVHEGTIRQALRLLNKIGLVETFNGIGSRTRCLKDPAPDADWTHPSIQKLLYQYLQMLQILVITFKSLTLYSYPKLDQTSKDQMIAALKKDCSLGWPENSLNICTKTIIHFSALKTIQEIFNKLRIFTYWGKCSLLTKSQDFQWWEQMLKKLINSLEKEEAK